METSKITQLQIAINILKLRQNLDSFIITWDLLLLVLEAINTDLQKIKP